jgi:hypothetical protein
VTIHVQRLQTEEYGSCQADSRDLNYATESSSYIYIILLILILLGISFLTSLIRSPSLFRREAVHSFYAVAIALATIPCLHAPRIVLTSVTIDQGRDVLKHMESILWLPFMDNVCASTLTLLILFGPSVRTHIQ